ncbi:unnamed protein product [Rhizoctonia solani]|uniref:Protein ROT1 n=1 Tax=Rhizoctonia solani TaxID=456999 RepID=A0A8H2XXY2_9AGAM|nr:unnamed protein product [Rhizoctonia solani]
MLVALLALIPLIHAQVILYDTSHNTTSLRGTWSTTTDYVLTSSMIANPVNSTFNVPEEYKSASSASYSFTDDGFWEQYIYRLVAHGTSSCTQGLTIYQHGTYTHGPDGSLLLVPFWQDGRIQILDQWAGVAFGGRVLYPGREYDEGVRDSADVTDSGVE